MSDLYDEMVLPETYPAGRVCEAETCTARLSIYNPDDLCARCEKIERAERFEAERVQLEATNLERLEFLWDELMGRLLEEACV